LTSISIAAKTEIKRFSDGNRGAPRVEQKFGFPRLYIARVMGCDNVMNTEEAGPQSRELYKQRALSAGSFPSRYVVFGPFYLDLQKQQLLKGDSPVKLPGKVFEALLMLIENADEVVTRDALRTRLWPMSQVNYAANLNTTMNKLRQALGDSSNQPIFVVTVPRKGYSFIAKLEYLNSCPASDAASPEFPKLAADKIAEQVDMFPHSVRASMWFTTGAIALVIAGMLFGAALLLYAHKALCSAV
jgi:DNA-binding winged helix-turn-helix (wHTH) protein